MRLIIETLLSFIWLSLPSVWAVLDDRNGDKHPNHDNVSVTIFGLILSALYALLMRTVYDYDFYLMWICCGLVSAGIYMFIFPYAISYVLIKRGVMNRPYWYDALNDEESTWPDNWKWWRSLNWRVRMGISLFLFILFCVPYFKLICDGRQ